MTTMPTPLPATAASTAAPVASAAWPDLPARVPPPGLVAELPDRGAVSGWAAPRLARLRRAGRPCQLLRLMVTAVAADDDTAAPDAASQALLLAACAQRLRARVRATDQVARVGDEGFAVLLDGATPAGAQVAAMRLTQVCEGPYRIGERRLALRLQIEVERVLRLV